MVRNKMITIEADAIKIKQRPLGSPGKEFQKENDFFIFSLKSNILLNMVKFLSRNDSALGIQRKHKEERDRQIGNFIASEHPFFPNTIIVNIPLEFRDNFYKNGILKFEINENSAYVIDGQHRLKAFASKYSQGVELSMVVAAYFGLELPTIAEIFTRINFYQTPVSKSLVYDLLNFNKDPEFAKYKEAHEIVSVLNEKINSPFYGLIKILGTGDGLLSQAAFVEAVSTRYRIIDLLKKYSMDDKIQILDNYFSAVRNCFPNKWANKKSILSRTIGFNALVKLLNSILSKNPNEDFIAFDFYKCIKMIKHIDIDSEDIKSYGGFKGVNNLADKFISNLRDVG